MTSLHSGPHDHHSLTFTPELHSLSSIASSVFSGLSGCLGCDPAEVTALSLTVHHCTVPPEQDSTRRRRSVIGSSVRMALSHSISRQDALRWGHMACLTGKERVWMAQNDKMVFSPPLAMSCFQGREACRGADRYSARRKTDSSPQLTSPSRSWGCLSPIFYLSLSLFLSFFLVLCLPADWWIWMAHITQDPIKPWTLLIVTGCQVQLFHIRLVLEQKWAKWIRSMWFCYFNLHTSDAIDFVS